MYDAIQSQQFFWLSSNFKVLFSKLEHVVTILGFQSEHPEFHPGSPSYVIGMYICRLYVYM